MEAYTGMPGAPGPEFAGPLVEVTPLPYEVTGPWTPPGMRQPWPQDEYLYDGGDSGSPVHIDGQWMVHGLETEDTIAHFDTLDGRRVVEASNRVHIYSPRFGAVRHVTSLVQNEQTDGFSTVDLPLAIGRQEEVQIAGTAAQDLQLQRDVMIRRANVFQADRGDGALSSAVTVRAFQDAFLPFENLSIIRTGMFQQEEMARLATSAQAAIVWSKVQEVQVVLDRQSAGIASKSEATGTVYTVNSPPGNPKLRVIKVASSQTASPGDMVDFTIRYDNIGNQPIGNVTIIDNLTTRLDYVRGTAQSSLPADFLTEPNDGQSLVLRWEVLNPVEPGQGGIIRFRCRVR